MRQTTDTQAFLQLFAALVKATSRQKVARRLARYLGAQDLLIFLLDTEAGVLLPAPGLRQTLPNGPRWQAFLASCGKKAPTYAMLPWPSSTVMSTAMGLADDNGTVLVLLGGTPQLAKVRLLVTLLPALEAVLQREQRCQRAEAEAKIARMTAEKTQTLLTMLDETRQKVQDELCERHNTEAALQEQGRLAALQMEISTALTTGGTVCEILDHCARALVHHLDAAFARVWTLNEAEQMLELKASAGIYTRLDGENSRVPVGSWKVGVIGQRRKPHLTNAVIGDPLVRDQEWAAREGMVAFAGYPLLVEDRLLGVMALFARHPLTETTLEAMAAVAKAIALGLEHHQAVEAIHQKQQMLGIALAASETGTFRWSPTTGNLLECDSNYRRLCGLAPDEPLKGIEDFLARIHHDDLPTLTAAVDRCRQGADFEMEYRIIHPDGSVHWLYNRAKMEHDEQGKPLYLVGASTDVTRRKQAEEELRESAARLRVLAESVPQKIFTAKPNGQVDYLNPQWTEFTSIQLGEITDWGWLRLIHPDDVEENVRRWQHSLETGEPFLYEHRFRRTDGVYRWHISRAIPLRDAQGHITMWIGSSTDITEQKELESQKEVLVSMTTHELKTPLTSMKGYMQLAERRLHQLRQSPQMEQAEQQKILDQVLSMLSRSQQQLSIQNRLITDLLDASRMQKGTLTLHPVPSNLGNLVRKTVENYQAAYPQRPITLTLPEQITLTAHIDCDRIEQVLSNYLTNALKYSASDKAVHVGMDYEPPLARIWVADHGPGLSLEEQQHIWERFYRVPGTVVQNYTGASLGLGLSICQGIIHGHHGHVGVESTPGQGSRFWFTLPLLSPDT